MFVRYSMWSFNSCNCEECCYLLKYILLSKAYKRHSKTLANIRSFYFFCSLNMMTTRHDMIVYLTGVIPQKYVIIIENGREVPSQNMSVILLRWMLNVYFHEYARSPKPKKALRIGRHTIVVSTLSPKLVLLNAFVSFIRTVGDVFDWGELWSGKSNLWFNLIPPHLSF